MKLSPKGHRFIYKCLPHSILIVQAAGFGVFNHIVFLTDSKQVSLYLDKIYHISLMACVSGRFQDQLRIQSLLCYMYIHAHMTS